VVAPVKKHSKYSPSSAYRWFNCHASIALIDKAPPQKSSKFADEGTKAHELMEKLLTKEIDIFEAYDLYDEEMVDHVVAIVDAVSKVYDPRFAELLVEEKLILDVKDDLSGTVDCAVVSQVAIDVFDYKHGKGLAVDAEKNLQLLFYLLSLTKKVGVRPVMRVHIVQPRAYHAEGPLRSWEVTNEVLADFEEQLYFHVKQTKKKSLKPVAGDWCQFCPAKIMCPAMKSLALAEAQLSFDDDLSQLPAPQTFTPIQLSRLLEKADLLEGWVSAVRAHALYELEQGREVAGFKLVAKRATRKWFNAAEVEREASEVFGAKAFNRELKSPAQLEKVTSKDWVKERCVAISSGNTYAPTSDPRPEVKGVLTAFDSD
jgi:hypothetical protein